MATKTKPKTTPSNPEARKSPPGALQAAFLLTAVNLLNYADRYVPSAVKDLYKRDLGLSDTETSLPLTAFVLVYIVASPIFSSLADRFSRKTLIATGVIIWSLATASAALATGFATLFASRALVGIGEAAYATLSPPLLSDFYPPRKRNRVLMIFSGAIPVGAAVGFSAAAWIARTYDWRTAFLCLGVPGILAALAILTIKEPPRGYFDKQQREHNVTWPKAIQALRKNGVYITTVLGYAAVMFAGGAIADWYPTYLQRERGFDIVEAGTTVGGVTLFCGFAGTLAGGWLADKFVGVVRNPYLTFSGVMMIPATLCASLTLLLPGKMAVVVCLAIGQFFAWSYNGPINALLVNSVPSNLRTRAISLSVLATHLLGDAVSPSIVGFISDHSHLSLALWAAPAALVVGTLIWLIGSRVLTGDDEE